MKHVLLFALYFLFTNVALALAPEDGIWYSPSQPGRGWVITSQNDVMAVSTYTYSASGAPTWYLSVGSYNDSSKRFNGQLNGTTNGQCIGCPYRAPTSTGSVGELQIQFVNEDTAQLLQAGETVQIKKYYYAFANENDRLYGEWSFAGLVALSIGDGEFFAMDSQYISPTTGKSYVRMKRKFSTLGTGLVAYETSGKYLALFQSSSSYYKAYEFKAENSRILDGRWWLFRTTETISGSGDYFTGHRTAEKNDIGVAAKLVTNEHAQVTSDSQLHSQMKRSTEPLDVESQVVFDELLAELQGMQN